MNIKTTLLYNMETTKKGTKLQIKSNFAYIPQREKTIPILREINTRTYVMYGENNLYPQYLWDLYLKSSVLQSIINGTTDYVCGNEVKVYNGMDTVNADGETIEDIVKKITTDLQVFGGFALNIIYNRANEVAEIYWVDVRDVRLNEDGDVAYYCKNWKNKKDVIEYEVFPNHKGGSCIFYFSGHLTRGIYPIPRWNGAIPAVETSAEIGSFHLHNILNNFEPSAIINFNNGVPDEETQNNIEAKVNEKFTGSHNAGKVLISFNDNKDSAVTIERLGDENNDKKYQELRKDTFNEIFIAFRAQPQLFGFVIEGSLFNHDEFTEAFALYNKNVVKPIQKDIIRSFDKIFDTQNSIFFEDWSMNNAVTSAEEQMPEEGNDKNIKNENNE